MKRRIHSRLREARPPALDTVPDADRQERDLRAAFGQVVRRTQTRQAGRFRPVLWTAAAGTAVAAAGVLIGSLLTGQEKPTAETKPGPATVSAVRSAPARSVLFEVADIASQEPDLTRQRHIFWHRTGQRITFRPGRSGNKPAVSRIREEYWISVHDDDPGLITLQGGGQKTVAGTLPGESPFYLGEVSISVPELIRLPAEPEALSAALHAKYRADGAKGSAERSSQWLFTTGAALVGTWPVRSATRAAGFRMLAGLPDVREVPNVTDPLGRPGTAIAVRGWVHGVGTAEHRLVFDPRSAGVLSIEVRRLTADGSTGRLVKATVTESVDWTKKRPPYPARNERLPKQSFPSRPVAVPTR